MSNGKSQKRQNSFRVTVHLRSELTESVSLCGVGRRNDGSEGSSWSARVSELADRMNYLIRSHLPCFTRPEWCAIMDANNGGPFPDSEPALIKSMFWANVEDSVGLDAKWSVDSASIVQRLQQLTPAESIALGEASRFFWDNCHQDTDLLFDRLGIA